MTAHSPCTMVLSAVCVAIAAERNHPSLLTLSGAFSALG